MLDKVGRILLATWMYEIRLLTEERESIRKNTTETRLGGVVSDRRPAVWSRSNHRMVHVVLATVLGTYLYSPLADVASAELAVQLVIFPVLALSGLLMWKGQALRRRLRSR